MPELGGDRMWGLRELPLPEPISWFPATPAWLFVLACALVLAAWLAWRGYAAWRRQRYRRVALARVAAMRGGASALVELPLVLRTTALAAFPREEVASLRGDDWVRWLNRSGAGFEAADAAWLDRLPYEPSAAERLPTETAERLLDASRAWLRNHRARV